MNIPLHFQRLEWQASPQDRQRDYLRNWCLNQSRNYLYIQSATNYNFVMMCAPDVHHRMLHPACTPNYSSGIPFRKLSNFDSEYSSVFWLRSICSKPRTTWQPNQQRRASINPLDNVIMTYSPNQTLFPSFISTALPPHCPS